MELSSVWISLQYDLSEILHFTLDYIILFFFKSSCTSFTHCSKNFFEHFFMDSSRNTLMNSIWDSSKNVFENFLQRILQTFFQGFFSKIHQKFCQQLLQRSYALFSKISPVICPRISSRILSKNQSRIRLAIFITRNSTGDSFSNSTDISVSQRAVGENLVWVAPKVEFRQKLLQGFVLEFLEEILKKIFMDFFKKSFREFLKLFHALRLFQKCIQLFH